MSSQRMRMRIREKQLSRREENSKGGDPNDREYVAIMNKVGYSGPEKQVRRLDT